MTEEFKAIRKNKNKILFILVLTGVGWARSAHAFGVGDAPSYVSVSSCPPSAQKVIAAKFFPPDLIHSCKARKEKVDGRAIELVTIAYGEEQDCPAGCFYEGFIGVVLPGEDSIATFPPLDETAARQQIFREEPFLRKQNMHNFACADNYNIENFADVDIGYQDGSYGWRIVFHRPYSCTWENNISTRITPENTAINEGYYMSRFFEGSVFVSSRAGEIVWDLKGLKVSDRKGKNYREEKPL